MKSEPLQQIIYFSKAVKLMEEAELMLLLKECRELNNKDEVTGMLLYIKSEIYGGLQGRFIQIIEGAEQVITDTFARINADKRHQNVTILMKRTTYSRDFADWTMGFEYKDANELPDEIKSGLTNDLLKTETGQINIPLEYLTNFYALRATD